MNACDMKTCVMCYQGMCLIPSSYEKCPYTLLKYIIAGAKLEKQTKWELAEERLPTEEGMYLLCSADGDIYVRYFNPKASTYNVNGIGVFKRPGMKYWIRLFIPEVPVKGDVEF